MQTNPSSIGLAIRPSVNNPIVIISSDEKSYTNFVKYWVHVYRGSFSPFQETLKVSRCKLKKFNPGEPASIEQFTSADQIWSKPEDVGNNFVGIAMTYYNHATNSFEHKLFHKQSGQISPEQKELNYNFANNPINTFTSTQARSLWLILDRQSIDESKEPGMVQFLLKYPQSNDPEFITNLPDQNLTFGEFPNSIELAIEAKLKSAKPKPIKQAKTFPQHLQFVQNPPTQTNPATIFINSPINHGITISKHQPAGLYHVWIENTPATQTKRAREVAYARPLEANAKNPAKQSFPLCPLKSTTALLFWDANAESPNHNQPVVKSIDTHNASFTAIAEFMAEYGKYLPSHQPTIRPSHQPTNQEPSMQTKICRYCGGEFRANNAKIIYCSPSCRINFNAGKTFGAKQSQQTQLQPQQPVAPLPADHVTREEFQALSAQLGQVLALLQK